MRQLSIIPIIHSRYDLGSLETRVSELKAMATSGSRVESAKNIVESFWDAVRLALQDCDCDLSQALVYQDGLPNTGHVDALIEHRIVDDLAGSGSPNHQLLRWMIDQGATLIGTESTELLLKEYDLVRKALAEGMLDYGDNSQEASDQLRLERDRYIAKRIDDTLAEGATGLIFLGMLHRLEELLPGDIQVSYPIGQPRSKVRILQQVSLDTLDAAESL